MQEPEWFRTIYVSSEVWQTVGWGTILYLAALTTIDEQLYEAARIDGANRWQQTWHVTLPGIRPTMMTLLILNIGTFMAVGLREDPAAVQPADLPDRRRHLHVPVPGRASCPATSATPPRSACSRRSSALTLVLSANAISRRTVGASLW